MDLSAFFHVYIGGPFKKISHQLWIFYRRCTLMWLQYGDSICNLFQIQWGLLTVILDNVISSIIWSVLVSQIPTASLIQWKGSLDNGTVWLKWSLNIWPKMITISSTYYIYKTIGSEEFRSHSKGKRKYRKIESGVLTKLIQSIKKRFDF